MAWLFNLRGRDIPYNPVFRAYAVVGRRRRLDDDTNNGNAIDDTTAAAAAIYLYIPPEKQTSDVIQHLNSEVFRRGIRIQKQLCLITT